MDLENEERMFSEIAKGNQCSKLLARRFLDNTGLQTIDDDEDSGFVIKGTRGLAVNLGSCCYPIPYDTIIAQIEPSTGLRIHRSDCAQLRQVSLDDQLTTSWASELDQSFLVPIQISAKNRVGVLSTISNIFKQSDVNIEDLNIYGDRDRKELRFLIRVKDKNHLKELISTIKSDSAIYDVSRLFNLSSGSKA